jgi:hypothetical protein
MPAQCLRALIDRIIVRRQAASEVPRNLRKLKERLESGT